MKNFFKIFLIVFVSLFNYQSAKFLQLLVLKYYPNFSYPFSISIPWLIIAFIPLIFFSTNSFKISTNKIKLNRKTILFNLAISFTGLLLFVFFGVTKYFHVVKYPLIFFIMTPIVEEAIFRGFVYNTFEKINRNYPVVISSALFGLHHLQYFNYSLTKFALFQIVYTFILGLFLGKIRKSSGSIYIGLILHIFINFVSVYY